MNKFFFDKFQNHFHSDQTGNRIFSRQVPSSPEDSVQKKAQLNLILILKEVFEKMKRDGQCPLEHVTLHIDADFPIGIYGDEKVIFNAVEDYITTVLRDFSEQPLQFHVSTHRSDDKSEFSISNQVTPMTLTLTQTVCDDRPVWNECQTDDAARTITVTKLLEDAVPSLSLQERTVSVLVFADSNDPAEISHPSGASRPSESVPTAGVTTPSSKAAHLSGNTGDSSGSLIQISLGLSYAGQSYELYHEILQEYIRVADENVELLQNYYTNKAWKDYIIRIHGLKSSSMTIGAASLSELAKKIEVFGKNGEYDAMISFHDEFLNLYRNVVDEGRQYFIRNPFKPKKEETIEPSSPESETPITPEEFSELVHSLKTSFDTFDTEEICKHAEKLRGCRFQNISLTAYAEKIIAKVNDFDYEEAAAVLSDLQCRLANHDT